MILLSDANVLIDLGYVGGLGILTQIAPTEVLDVVLLECEDERQPKLIEQISAVGVRVVTTEESWIHASGRYQSAALSEQDRLNLHYAKEFGRLLLATGAALRRRSEEFGVEVHGTLWLVEEALQRALVPPADLCSWLKVWPSLGSRLPAVETRRLVKLLGC